jgi:hypothetical protein
MKGKAVVLAAVLACIASPAALASSKHPPHLEFLQPGVAHANLGEQVPVNFVFVGFSRKQVNKSDFLDRLPDSYRPVIRSRLLYGVTEKLGIDWTYDYSVKYTRRHWEDAFFGALRRHAKLAPRTQYQDIYNEQDGVRDLGKNHYIDAPTVEKWLIDHAPYGVDTRHDTVFFINWWGRRDFINHVYTKFGEPDPDTGFDFGKNRDSRKIIGWGGTTPDDEETGLGRRGVNRVWFFDLSAGPEAWGGNYDVTHKDLDGDGEPDYRIPVAWEYADDGYRSPSRLTSDLALVARYGAINLLFTTSPSFPPYLTPDLLPRRVNLDLNTYEGWPGVDASARYEKPNYLLHEENELFPSPILTSADQEDFPFEGKNRQCWILELTSDPCYPNRPQYPGDANIFLYSALHINDFLDHPISKSHPTPTRLLEAPEFAYSTTDDLTPGFLGYTDDNWVDGTQSIVVSAESPSIAESGYGITTTEIHEFGHFFGMSHPHDGYDSETGVDYEPTGPFFFAWAPDESNSMMSYIDLNWDFSQFDRDNAARDQAAGYIRSANLVAEKILSSANASKAKGFLAAADKAVGRAERAMRKHEYPETWQEARKAYEIVLGGAERADVEVLPSYDGWKVLPPVIKRTGRDVSGLWYGAADEFGPGTHRSLP